ncbi:MAG: hypothetical protein ACPGU7_10510 [Gammaproteobacteria bacterium]
MKTRRLLDQVGTLLGMEDKDLYKQRKALCETVKKLKHKERVLKERREDTDDKDKRRKLAQKIQVIKAQRRKAIDRYRELKSG